MPNGHDYSKEYGSHSYEKSGTSDCKYECGCWAGDTRSGGPVGLDPLHGECPNNPKSGKQEQGKNVDYEIVVERRIRALEFRANKANEFERELGELQGTQEAELLEEVKELRKELEEKNGYVKRIKDLVTLYMSV